jgi:peptidoglycan/xylan/chitin deacetylase (PgdA/CDA1 family)
MARELILTFHGLGEPPAAITDREREFWVPIEWFEAIVDVLPAEGVGLAFDDGNISDVRQALPVLIRRRVNARFFPPTGAIGAEGKVSREDIVQLRTAGMEIGSHGLHHRDWRTLSDRELYEEVIESRRTLAGIVGSEITQAACPFGSYDRRVLRALRAAGYRRVFTSDGGTDSADSWPSARTTVDRSRTLQEWLDLVASGAGSRPGVVQSAKRLVKRLR